MKILDLVLRHEWYDMIDSGEKPEEYREIGPYWINRLTHLEDWKIAGEEMGLGKPWKPNYDSGVDKFGIICMNGIIQESNPTTHWERHLNKVLDFPTEEMRDAFKESEEISKLIDKCKELL